MLVEFMQLFVIGMHRSGTSAVARCLNLYGAYFGPEEVSIGANKENPKGFWERRDVRRFNDHLLHAAGADWDRVSDFSVEKIPAAEKSWTEREIASLLQKLDEHRPWFVKEPRLSLVFPVWRPLLEAPVCIHVHRHPLEVALSLRKRNGFSIPFGIALWERYVLAGFAATSGLPRLIISWRDLLHSPWETMCNAAAELRKLGVVGLCEPTRTELNSFIEPELYHHRRPVEETGYLQAAQHELLDLIESKAILECAPEALPALSSFSIDLLTAHNLLRNKVADLEAKVEEARIRPFELIELRKERDRLLEKIVAREKTLEDRSWKFSSVVSEFKAKIEKLESIVEKRNQQLKERRAWSIAARNAIEKRNQQLKTENEKVIASSNAIEEQGRQLRNEREKVIAAEARAERQNGQMAELRSQIEKLEVSQQTLETRWKRSQKDLADLNKWSEQLIDEVRRILRSKRWRVGCWLSLKPGGALGKEAQCLAHLLKTRPASSSGAASSPPASDDNSKKKEIDIAELEGAGANTRSSPSGRPINCTLESNEISQELKLADAASDGPAVNVDSPLKRPDCQLVQAPSATLPRLSEAPVENITKRLPPTQNTSNIRVDVVVCIHDALEDLRRCLASITAHSSVYFNRLILVNDGSEQATVDYLETFAASSKIGCLVIHRPTSGGYTKAANCGLRASDAHYVILLNSDTVVTPAWIDRLVVCGESDSSIGIVGPLSNAASWQSVPHRFGPNGDWAVNDLPLSALPRIACLFTILQSPGYPRVPLVNGFCFAIKRSVISAIGVFDEALFPNGYGEENDYCLRARRAGFKAAIADDCYVFHAKSKSYSHETRRALAKQSQAILREKYGPELGEATGLLRHSAALARARSAFAQLLAVQPCHALFLLNFRSAGGGSNSIVQEASGLRALGAAVQIAINSVDEEFYRKRFPHVPGNLFCSFPDTEELIAYGGKFEFVIATLFTGVRLLRQIVELFPDVVPCYYIQDYEPSFFHRSDLNFAEAIESYTLIPTTKRFAKTRWLCETVEREQGVPVYKVEPSIDHDIFFPDDSVKPGIPLVVCAMVRPMTERRSPGLTLEILNRIKREFGRKVEIRIFGVEPDDAYLHRHYSDYQHRVLGILTREAVAQLMRESSLFLDASAYQAFGRTGLEAMACRCATILPRGSGIDEYAVDGVNTLLAVPEDAGDFLEKVRLYLGDLQLYQSVVREGLKTAARFSIEKACRSELDFFMSLRQTNEATGITPLRPVSSRVAAV